MPRLLSPPHHSLALGVSPAAPAPLPGIAAIDALIARETKNGLLLRDTDRRLARLIGALLAEAGASSALFADAHPVAVAVEGGGGEVQTADPDDLGRLAAPYRTIVIEPLARKKGDKG